MLIELTPTELHTVHMLARKLKTAKTGPLAQALMAEGNYYLAAKVSAAGFDLEVTLVELFLRFPE